MQQECHRVKHANPARLVVVEGHAEIMHEAQPAVFVVAQTFRHA